MNAHAIVRETADEKSSVGLVVSPPVQTIDSSNEERTQQSDLNAALTNGDPPMLMLWGSED